ncbi:hypothetical protein IWW55_004880, partial [Coemansia sp. RSA 2706]
VDGCNITLDGTYSYSTLGDKTYELVTHMCNHPNKFADAYDLFVKIDDDVLYNPE